VERKTRYTKDRLEAAVASAFSYAQVLKELGLKPTGGNYQNLKAWILHHNIDISHFTHQAWSKGKTLETSEVICQHRDNSRRNLADSEVFVKHGRPIPSSRLKQRALRNGMLEDRCSVCGISDWQGKPLTLHLDHINGSHSDNRIENLRIICPNCHQQTATWGFRGRKRKDTGA